MQMITKHTKRHSTSLAIREMQIKTRVRYDYTPSRTARMWINCITHTLLGM